MQSEFPKTFPVTCHTDFVGPGSTFVVIQGQNQDGSMFIKKAVEKGAKQLVIDASVLLNDKLLQEISLQSVTVKRVDNCRKALALLSAQAAGFPAEKLKLIGATGTKGKTTTVHMLHHFLKSAGYKVALLSTVYNSIETSTFSAPLTTPQPDYLHQFFKLCVERGVEYVVMEVAAQASTFFRVEGIMFDYFLFTNLDQEHGELYPTREDYFLAKKELLLQCKQQSHVLINRDDHYGQRLLNEYPFTFYALENDANQYALTHFPGLFNQYNCCAARAVCKMLGINDAIIQKACITMAPLPGRLELYTLPDNVRVYIDYAHTPASFKALFSTVRDWTQQLIIVFGAGGSKDTHKRPLMGALAGQYADTVIVTTDNPRNEDPRAIAQEIVAGVYEHDIKKITIELDRQKAIEQACSVAQPGAVILLLGKGPDEYQEVNGVKTFFSEKTIVKNYRKQCQNFL